MLYPKLIYLSRSRYERRLESSHIQPELESMRLLVIEDDELFAGMVEVQLSVLMGKNFFETLAFFPSLCAAQAGIKEFKPDVVLFDIHLPDGRAFDEAAQWLMQSDVLRICMTGRKRIRYIRHAMENDVLAFVEKDNDFLLNLQKALSRASIQLRNRQQAEYFSHHAFQQQEHLRAALEGTQEQLVEKKRLLAQLVPLHTMGDIVTRQAVLPLRIVIVDDEKSQRSALKRKLEDTFGRQIIVSGEAFSVDSAISIITDCQPDLLFLDIDLIGGTGFDVLDAFPNPTFAVIFVTSFPEFGARAFRYAAIDYILKPVDPLHLQKAVERIFALRTVGIMPNLHLERAPESHKGGDHISQQSRIIQTKNERGAEKLQLRIRQDGLVQTIVISPHDILVIESNDNKVCIVLNDGKTIHEVTITLKALEALLPPSLFVRCHASYLVHLGSIIAFSAQDLTLTTGEVIPVSRARQEQTHAAIASYRLPKRPEYQVAHLA